MSNLLHSYENNLHELGDRVASGLENENQSSESAYWIIRARAGEV